MSHLFYTDAENLTTANLCVDGGMWNAKIVARTHLPPQEAEAEKDARVSGTHGNESGTQCPQAPAAERAMATDRLKLPPGPKGTNRFPKSERLSRQKDIQACLMEGKRYRHPLLTLFVRWRGGEGRRVAFSVGRKVAKKATQRNRIKRWLREAYRTKRWAMVDGVDLFIVAHPPIAAANFEAVDAALTELLWRAKVLVAPSQTKEQLTAPDNANGAQTEQRSEQQ